MRLHTNKTLRKALLLILVTAMLFTTLCTEAFAVEPGDTGTVATQVLNVRKAPGTDQDIVGQLEINAALTIHAETVDALGAKWYYISYDVNGKQKYGYVSADYVVVKSNKEYLYEGDFEQYLDQCGFPESYKPYLRQLHADHPTWVFKPAVTNLDWNRVVEKESTPGKSLVANSAPSYWKSKAAADYDSTTGKYTSYDSGNWNTASKALIKYYMDPRNFLNDIGVFQFLDHTFDINTQTIDGVNKVVASSFLDAAFPEDTSKTYSEVIFEAGMTKGVNPYVLASMILIEQGSDGKGGCISGKVSGYEGYYNFYNIGAYKTSTMSAVTRGAWYASQSGDYMRPWNTREKAIFGGAQSYSENYVKSNKNTFYFKKWNVMNGMDNVGQYQYMGTVQGAEYEATSARKGYLSVMDDALTFYIPIYDSMPVNACPIPTSDADNVDTGIPDEGTSLPAQEVTTAYTLYYRTQYAKGKTFNLQAQTSGNGELTYYSMNEDIATIDEKGNVKPTGNIGQCQIIVFASGTKEFAQSSKVVVLTVNEATKEEEEAMFAPIKKGVEKTTIVLLKAKALSSKKVQLTWKKSNSGYAMSYYQIWRSTKQNSGYAKIFTTTDGTKKSYTNSKGLKGKTTYWYKVRGVREEYGQKAYTPFTKVSVRTL